MRKITQKEDYAIILLIALAVLMIIIPVGIIVILAKLIF